MNGSWSRIDLGGKPADLYEPPARARFGVLFLHDRAGETLVGHTTFTALFDELGLACLCPHGGECWWADRLCPGFDAALTPERFLGEQVMPFFPQHLGLAPRAVGLLGIGMGGQGALRLAFEHPTVFRVAVALAPAVDYHELYGAGTPLDDMYDSKEQCRQDTATLHVHPAHHPPHLFFCIDPADPWYRGCDRLHEKLSALGVAHACDLTTQAGENLGWDYFDHMAGQAVRFLCAGLEEEGRRLL